MSSDGGLAATAPGAGAGFALTASAEDDLRRHVGAVAGDDPAEAARLLGAFEAAFRQIGQVPDLGHKRPELADTLPIRFWPVRRRFLVAYREPAIPGLEPCTAVLRVVDARRLGEA